jgi:hypothetical protein
MTHRPPRPWARATDARLRGEPRSCLRNPTLVDLHVCRSSRLPGVLPGTTAPPEPDRSTPSRTGQSHPAQAADQHKRRVPPAVSWLTTSEWDVSRHRNGMSHDIGMGCLTTSEWGCLGSSAWQRLIAGVRFDADRCRNVALSSPLSSRGLPRVRSPAPTRSPRVGSADSWPATPSRARPRSSHDPVGRTPARARPRPRPSSWSYCCANSSSKPATMPEPTLNRPGFSARSVVPTAVAVGG